MTAIHTEGPTGSVLEDVPDVHAAVDDRRVGASEGSAPLGWTGTGLDAIVCAVVALLGVLIVPSMAEPELQPKRLILVVVLPLGVTALIRLIRTGDRAALIGVAFVSWAIIVAMLSDAPVVALLGHLSRHQSILITASSLSLWALGRFVSDQGRALVAWTLVSVCAANAVLAVAQLAARPVGILELHRGRPTGLVIAPIILGAIAAATSVWFVAQYVESNRARHLVGIGSTVFLAGLSGTRVPVLVAVAALVAGAVIVRRRRHPRHALGLFLAGGVGYALAWVTYEITSRGRGLSSRTISDDGVADRLEIWSYALRGWWDRPITGVGVGRFAEAARPYAADDWVRRFPRAGWTSAHNVFLELLVTVGVPGVLLFVVFVVVAARLAGGALAWMAAAIAVTWLVEPATVVTMPLAAVLLGAASRAGTRSTTNPLEMKVALAIGLVLGLTFVTGDRQIDAAIRNEAAPPLTGTGVWFSKDPYVLNNVARTLSATATDVDADRIAVALSFAEAAIAADPDNVVSLVNAATLDHRLGNDDAARTRVDEALARWPNDVEAIRLRLDIAVGDDDRAAGRASIERLCEIFGRDECDVASAMVAAGFDGDQTSSTAVVAP